MSEVPATGDDLKYKNRLGSAGFICSLFGIITLGLLSPLALVVSAFALRQRPRGFAIAGTTLGLVGCVLLAAAGTLGYILAVLGGQVFAGILVAGAIEFGTPFVGAADAIDKYEAIHGALPVAAEGETLAASFKDLWGCPLRYSVDGKTFTLTSPGADGTFDTDDDIRYKIDGKDRRLSTSGPDGRFDTSDDVVSDPIPATPPSGRK